MAQLLSVNVGLPQDIAWHGRTVHTSVWKHSVSGRRWVRRLNIDGDKQGDLKGHGGEQRAVLVYQIESYHYWEKEFDRSDFVFGQFGENLTVTGLPDEEVCVGDRYRIGGAVFEVTQPRITCYRVGIRMGEPRMPALLVQHHRPGFYMRVLQEGEIGATDAIIKVADGPGKLSVTRADALVYLGSKNQDDLERALRIEAFSPGWKIAFRALTEQARGTGWHENKGIILNFGSRSSWPGFRLMKVARKRTESTDVVSLELVADEPLPPGLPGQFITLRLAIAGADTPLLRSYSLTDTSDAGRYPIAVKCEPHGIAGQYLREHVAEGAMIEVAAPRGGFTLRSGKGDQPIVLLSAGIGMTPVLAMLHSLAESAPARAVSWIHSARNGAEHPFAKKAARLLGRFDHARSLISYSRPQDKDRLGVDFDVKGRITLDTLRTFGIPEQADIYLCGPVSFMDDMRKALAAIPIPPAHIRTEEFGPRDSLMPGLTDQRKPTPHAPAGSPGDGPLVSFTRSGISVPWADRYGSLLELAEACDVSVRWACRTGVCHTCITRLLSGRVRYDPEPLERPTEDDALICCSRPVGETVLDL